MSNYEEVIISPCDLQNYSMIEKKIFIKKSNNVLISGRVIDIYNNPVVNAIISIRQVNNYECFPSYSQYGYVITNEEGAYAILLTCSDKFNYILDVYEPLIKDSCI